MTRATSFISHYTSAKKYLIGFRFLLSINFFYFVYFEVEKIVVCLRRGESHKVVGILIGIVLGHRSDEKLKAVLDLVETN
jgi:hypothetical protein